MASKELLAQRKLNEAQFFYERMVEARDNAEHVGYYLSALLTAARSVRAYVRSEIRHNSRLKVWWKQQQIHKERLTDYLDTRRNYEVHWHETEITGAMA